VKDLILGYFTKRNISKDAKFTANDQGYAQMHTGFDLCFLWQTNNFAEILSFCAFAPNEANAANRGVQLSLQNFVVKRQIAERKSNEQKKEPLSISL
jgi:hypothetical protein